MWMAPYGLILIITFYYFMAPKTRLHCHIALNFFFNLLLLFDQCVQCLQYIVTKLFILNEVYQLMENIHIFRAPTTSTEAKTSESTTEKIVLKFPTRPGSTGTRLESNTKSTGISGPPPFVPKIKSFADRYEIRLCPYLYSAAAQCDEIRRALFQ